MLENTNTKNEIVIAVAQYGCLGVTAVPSMIDCDYSTWLHSYRLLASKEALERFILPTRIDSPISQEIADALACVTWDKYFGHTNWPSTLSNNTKYIAVGISSGYNEKNQTIIHISFYTKTGITNRSLILTGIWKDKEATNFIQDEIGRYFRESRV
jgi:hypothetical protein